MSDSQGFPGILAWTTAAYSLGNTKEHCYSLAAQKVKLPPGSAGNADLIPGSGRSSRGGNGNHSSILAWKIPWTEEPGGLQSIGWKRVGLDLATWHHRLNGHEFE